MNSRRTFLKCAGVAALGVTALPAALEAYAPEHSQISDSPTEVTAKRWAMVVDTRMLQREADIEPLIKACHSYHNVPTVDEAHKEEEIKWIWTDEFEAAFPEFMTRFPEDRHPKATLKPFVLLCNHCTNPPCVRVCPTQATFKREDGIVMMDMHRCIGCRYCMAGCPYGARSFNWADPRAYLPAEVPNPKYPTRMKGVVEKCTFCTERLAEGLKPACVEASKGALLFGDLSDPESEVSKAIHENFVLRRKPSAGTQPNVYYII